MAYLYFPDRAAGSAHFEYLPGPHPVQPTFHNHVFLDEEPPKFMGESHPPVFHRFLPSEPSPRMIEVPQPPPPSPRKWEATMYRHPFPPITFEDTQFCNGIAMCSINNSGHPGHHITNGLWTPFCDNDIDYIRLWLSWPECEAREERIEIDSRVTISRLAQDISSRYARFIQKARPKLYGWQVGFEHLILLSLENIHTNIWQARVAVRV